MPLELHDFSSNVTDHKEAQKYSENWLLLKKVFSTFLCLALAMAHG